ncbi:FUSC family protein [Microbacterium esteraromaticum]|uniref:FUSC family protein n=1 Tax=Microbacterium esteraromaticum TaxID=57043 RepID=A0A939DUM9_9MICO|nr:FUSC family protein [Microbacterium esteraromaticum]MBN8204769.1 FUSC family protein [Microbacterium esteraromaticum]MBN8414923.1 FUSC family protein [Microbacterium esteraromaticum]
MDRTTTTTGARLSLVPPLRVLPQAAVLVALAAAALWAISAVFDARVASAAYLTMMLLLSPARSGSRGVRVLAAAWAVLIAVVGHLIGSLGLWATLVALVVVCLAQALYRIGDVAVVTRSPVNLVVFAGLAGTGTTLGEVAIGASIGAALMLLAALLVPTRPASAQPVPAAERLVDGVVLAVGAVTTVLVSTWLDFAYVNWALLSFCMIVAVGGPHRGGRARDRVIGTLIGTVAGTLASLLPSPLPLIIAVVAVLLCVTYQLVGDYTMFVVFLTPAVLLLSSTDQSALALGLGRIEAVLGSAIVAVWCTWLAHRLSRAVGGASARDTDNP